MKSNMQKFVFYQIMGYSLAIALALIFTRIEIFDFKLKTVIYPLAWIAFGVILYRSSVKLRGTRSAIRRTVLGITFALYVFGTLFLALKFAMCGEGLTDTKYVNREDDRLFLVCRIYDCYEEVSKCQFMEVKTFVLHIRWVTKVDKDRVDLSKWKRTDKYE